MSPEELLTVKEFADRVRQHPMSVYRRIRENRQPGVRRFGRDIRIDVSEAMREPPNPTVSNSLAYSPAFGGLFKRV